MIPGKCQLPSFDSQAQGLPSFPPPHGPGDISGNLGALLGSGPPFLPQTQVQSPPCPPFCGPWAGTHSVAKLPYQSPLKSSATAVAVILQIRTNYRPQLLRARGVFASVCRITEMVAKLAPFKSALIFSILLHPSIILLSQWLFHGLSLTSCVFFFPDCEPSSHLFLCKIPLRTFFLIEKWHITI